jgi:uncharacterized protein YdeI (YjbR/CyaY-like superfamily)
MTAAGLAKVEDAKRDGSWEKLVSIDALRTPQDLQSALAKDDKARKNYESLSDSAKKQILWWIESAKTSDTRIKRIKGSVEKLQKSNERPFS